MFKSHFSLALLFSFLFFGCGTKEQTEDHGPDALAAKIDSTVSPGEDFFMFANGKWFKANPIPDSESSNGIFRTIQDTVNASILDICQKSAEGKHDAGSLKQMIGDLYFSGMDSAKVESDGISGLANELALIDQIKDNAGLMKAVARVQLISSSPMMGIYVGQDDKLSDKNAVFLYQSGLGLPSRDYYIDKDERSSGIREKYKTHLKNMFMLMGKDEASATTASTAVYKLEESLAKASRKIEDLRDPFANYNKVAASSLKTSYPNIAWDVLFTDLKLKTPDTVIIGQPEFIAAVNSLNKSTSPEVWKDYLKFHLVKGLASYMHSDIYNEYFSFYATTLSGIKEQKPRWKRVVSQTDESLGELIGQIYVDEYLPKGSKEKLEEIGHAIKTVFGERIQKLDWMSEATKVKAMTKLNTMNFKVGYPDKWKDLSSMKIDRSSYVKNVINANEWHTVDMFKKYGKPVDRSEWHMQPQNYNAYYSPSNNEIVVPACNVIVPGYERTLADDAILYSIIGGSTFGHEITHGFDDQGSLFDEKGNLNNWWTSEDSTKFFTKTKLVVDQYNKYLVIDSLFVNGDATQGENIADIGGIMMGYEAFKRTRQYKEGKKIGGLTPDERFFLGYATAWMVNTRPEALANQVKTDVHSPARFRILGPLSNMPEFYTTFGIKEGDKMWIPEKDRAAIW